MYPPSTVTFEGRKLALLADPLEVWLTPRPLLVPQTAHLVDHSGHELWVWLLVRQKLSNDFVHDILGWEEVIQELRQDPGHHPGFTGKALPDPGRKGWTRDSACSLTPKPALEGPTWNEGPTGRDTPSGAQAAAWVWILNAERPNPSCPLVLLTGMVKMTATGYRLRASKSYGIDFAEGSDKQVKDGRVATLQKGIFYINMVFDRSCCPESGIFFFFPDLDPGCSLVNYSLSRA